MIEIIGALLRWLQLASNMILIGSCVFLAIAVRSKTILDTPWLARLARVLPWLSVTLLLGLLGLLATTTAQATGMTENAWRPEAWLELLQKTRIGLIWTVRAALALLVFGWLSTFASHLGRAGGTCCARPLPRSRWPRDHSRATPQPENCQ